MGKTALCLNISQHVGLNTDQAVGFFSMEMSKEQLVIRMLCADASSTSSGSGPGFISERELEKLRLSAEALAHARIFIDETPGLTLMEMKAKARRLKMERNLDIVFIDYIQLMRPGGRFENRNQEMAFISRSLKELAKELQIPVVGISQLSRAPEKGRREPRPQLSDLRESGAIEQDADVVIFIYRPESTTSAASTRACTGMAEVNVAKQRNGPTERLQARLLRTSTPGSPTPRWISSTRKPEMFESLLREPSPAGALVQLGEVGILLRPDLAEPLLKRPREQHDLPPAARGDRGPDAARRLPDGGLRRAGLRPPDLCRLPPLYRRRARRPIGGPIISLGLAKELIPILVGLMVAGRVGSSMAAEIGTMRITEQIDALFSLGPTPSATWSCPGPRPRS